MKTFGKIMICFIIIILAVAIAYSMHTSEKEVNGNTLNSNTPTIKEDSNNNQTEDTTSNTIDENKDYIGEEEKKSELPENNEEQKKEPEAEELTGKNKAIDIVKKQYATNGQTVRFDHFEESDYIIKVNEGTAVTWYIVNGTTWEAREY